MPTQVDFYILGTSSEQDRLPFACRLAEKAVQRGHRVFVATPSVPVSHELDALLWTFREESFLAHALVSSPTSHAQTPLEAVLVGAPGASPLDPDVVINLTTAIPDFASLCPRIAEIVAGGDEVRAVARDRYREYREHGFDLRTHQQ